MNETPAPQLDSPPQEPSVRRRVRLAALILTVAVACAYAGSFSGKFIFDDFDSILGNKTIRSLTPLSEVLFSNAHKHGTTSEGRPLLNLSFALNYAAGGIDVRGYHAVNLAIHLLAALVLFGIVRRTLRLPSCCDGLRSASPEWLALAVALFWALHPLQTESVTYIVQRVECMMGLFYLLAVYFFVRSVDAQAARPRLWQAGAVLACALGMASKEVMVTAPLLVLLYDWFFVAGSLRAALRRRRGFHLAMFLTWGVLAALLMGPNRTNLNNIEALFQQMQGHGDLLHTPGHELPWTQYALTQIGAVVHYLRLIFWPSPLIVDYGREVVQSFGEVAPAAVILGILLAGSILMFWRQRWITFAAAWFFIILSPTSSIIPLNGQTIAEHRLYLPLAGVAVIVVLGAQALWLRLRQRPASGAVFEKKFVQYLPVSLLALTTAALAAATIMRNRDYDSALVIWEDTVRKRPLNPRAHSNLASVLDSDPLRHAEAYVHFQRALELDPKFPQGRYNLANNLLKQDRLDEAIAIFEDAMKQGRIPQELAADACNNLGMAYAKKGLLEDAIRHFQAALKVDPDHAESHNNLGNALRHSGRISEATVQYKKAIELVPEYADAHYNLGILLFKDGKIDDALHRYQRAVELQPAHADAQYNLGVALFLKGRMREAAEHYEKALAVKPEYVNALNNLAWVLSVAPDAAQRDGPRALKLVRQAMKLGGENSPLFLHTHAAALAEAGLFSDAAQSAERALKLAQEQGNTLLAGSIEQELKHYQAGRPMRDMRPPAAP